MICLVTGGAGFIGSHLVDRLIELGNDVVVLDDCSTGQIVNINKDATFIQRSINDSLNSVFDKYHFDYVFHLAAQINLRKSFEDPIKDAQTNILGSLNVIQNAARTKVKKLIFASTGGAIYNKDAPMPWSEVSTTGPESPYGLGKLTVENYLRIFSPHLDSAVLRYSNVYGPRQNAKGEAGVIAIFLEQALRKKRVHIFGDGNQTRDFVYVDDVVNANLHAMNENLSGHFNVSTNISASVNEIADLINIFIPVVREYCAPISGELQHTQLFCDKLQNTGWHPTWNLGDGIRTTFEYFQSII